MSFRRHVPLVICYPPFADISSLPLKEHIQTYVPLTLETIKTENGFVVLGPEDVIPFYFNISFMTNARPLCTMENAVAYVASILNAKETGVNLARQWIFPRPEDFRDAPSAMLLKGGIEESHWIDSGLNPEQQVSFSLQSAGHFLNSNSLVGCVICCAVSISCPSPNQWPSWDRKNQVNLFFCLVSS